MLLMSFSFNILFITKINRSSFTILVLFYCIQSNAQLTFQKYIPDSAIQSKPTSIMEYGNGYMIYGWDSWQFGILSKNKLTVTNRKGDTVLTKFISDAEYSFSSSLPNSIVKIEDGYLMGASRSKSNESKPVLIKLDSELNELWRVIYGYNISHTRCTEILPIETGYMIYGYSNVFDQQFDIYLLNTDFSGNVIWEKSYGVFGDQDVGLRIVASEDGGYLLSGIYRKRHIVYGSWQLGKGEGYLLKIDNEGNPVWDKYYRNLNDMMSFSIEKSNSSYILWGNAYKDHSLYPVNDSLIFIEKIDLEGNKIWKTSLYAPEHSIINQLRELDNGNIVFAGSYQYNDRNLRNAGWIGMLDSKGKVLWERHHLNNQQRPEFRPDLKFNDFIVLKDGGFVLAGEVWKVTEANGAYRLHTYLVKLDSLGCFSNDCGILPRTDISKEKIVTTAFPNPFKDVVMITVKSINHSNEILEIKIIDVLGRVLGTYPIQLNIHGDGITTMNLKEYYSSQGLLIYQILDGKKSIVSGKLISL